MDSFLPIGIAAAASVLLLAVGLLAAWRLIPRVPSSISVSERLADLDSRLEALRLMYDELADKYESATNRAKGRKRKRDAEEDEAPAMPPPAPVAPVDPKAAMRARAKELGLRGV